MERQLTIQEAWEDFLQVIFPTITERKKRLDILRAISHERAGKLGDERRKRILKEYADTRYRFEERIILVEQ